MPRYAIEYGDYRANRNDPQPGIYIEEHVMDEGDSATSNPAAYNTGYMNPKTGVPARSPGGEYGPARMPSKTGMIDKHGS